MYDFGKVHQEVVMVAESSVQATFRGFRLLQRKTQPEGIPDFESKAPLRAAGSLGEPYRLVAGASCWP